MTTQPSYSNAQLLEILHSVKTIAMVGASATWNRPSYFAMKYLQEKGYRVIPVNKARAGGEILGEPVVGSLGELEEPVDLVDVFRASEHVAGIVDEAIALGIPALWFQDGVIDVEAAERARQAGLTVVMNDCTLRVHQRLLST